MTASAAFNHSLLAANVCLLLFYGILLVSVLRTILRSPMLRRLSSYFVAFSFSLLVVYFSVRLLFTWPSSEQLNLELALLLIGIIPAGLFVFLRRETAMLSSMENSGDRFAKLKDEFLTVASHELRTPLSVINGFAEILVREKLGKLNDEQKRRVRKILMQGQRLNRIIDELLDMSRIRSGKIEVKSDVFDIVPVLKACLDDQMIVCEQQGIELIDKIPDVLPDIVGDLERVTQVIVNLLGNAVKYTPIRGTVSLSASYDERKKRVMVHVVDTGIGVNPKDQPHVFDEFYRATSQTGTKYKGSGLGLAIVKQLVEALGGTVGLKSQGVGKGSHFYFTLRIAKEAQRQLHMPNLSSAISNEIPAPAVQRDKKVLPEEKPLF